MRTEKAGKGKAGRHDLLIRIRQLIGSDPRGYTFLIVAAAVLLIQFPVRVLLAEIAAKGAYSMLDDPKTGVADIVAIDDTTYTYHRSAERLLTAASLLDASEPRYRLILGDLAMLRAKWTSVMEEMHAVLPLGAESSAEAYQRAEARYRAAIHLSPDDYRAYVSLGYLSDQLDPAGPRAEREYDRALLLSPRNNQLRLYVAMQHLLAGRSGRALEQARLLAQNDGTGSYLMQAFEVAWRASRGDASVVRGMATKALNGEEKVMIFLQSKTSGNEDAR